MAQNTLYSAIMDAKAKARVRVVSKVSITSDGCWIWCGNPRENGYCRTTFQRTNWYVHRLSYWAFNDDIKKDNDVCHHCDVRACCNPNHLFQGSRKENMEDAVKKGRQAKGALLPQTKLTEADKDIIIKRASSGEPYKHIAEDYGVCRQVIGQIAIKSGLRRKNVVSK